jgi:cellulose synthase/poly-beta-1,6-N-acetylglucosamine synthase-like glycosyltransferase
MMEDCLRSVLALERRDIKILVIDQSNDDETRRTVEAAAAADPRVAVISSTTTGISEARNLAVKLATSDVIAFVDDDCVVEPGWLDALLREFEDPEVVGVYGRIVPPGFTTRNGPEIAFKESRERQVFEGRVPPWYVGHGANRAIRGSAVAAIGGFDIYLGPGATFNAAEDIDMAYRLLAAGGRLVYTGSAVAHHKEWRDWRSRRKRERSYGVGPGAVFMKYVRCGDNYGARLFATWIWELGVRRVGAGLFKWRSLKPIYLGYCQLVYPWIGAARSLRFAIDDRSTLYLGESQGSTARALQTQLRAREPEIEAAGFDAAENVVRSALAGPTASGRA